jgi:hypothetical protein
MAGIGVGDVTDFGNFMGAVIDERAWNRHAAAITRARSGTGGRLVAGGAHSRELGFFVHPTLVETDDLRSPFLTDELFGPIVGVQVYPEKSFAELLGAIDESSTYGLTGAIFAQGPRGNCACSGPAARRRREFLHQRQTHRRCRRPAAFRRVEDVGHQRQGGLDVEPDPLGVAAGDQGKFRAAARLALSVPGHRLRLGECCH